MKQVHSRPIPKQIGDWIMTHTGRKIYPLSPGLSMIHIEDIAHGLSMKCRFNGQCSSFYSVAQHSIMVSVEAHCHCKLEALFHDAAEAYLPDVSRPIKSSLKGFHEIENNLLSVIFEKFKLDINLMSDVKEIDDRMCITEGTQLMPDTSDWQMNHIAPFDIELVPMSPDRAKQAFLNRARMLFDWRI